MRLSLKLWGRRKDDGTRYIEVTEINVEGEQWTEKVIWEDSFYQKKGESIMTFSRRFLETELKEKYEEAECVLAYGMNHCFHRSLWIKEAKQ